MQMSKAALAFLLTSLVAAQLDTAIIDCITGLRGKLKPEELAITPQAV